MHCIDSPVISPQEDNPIIHYIGKSFFFHSGGGKKKTENDNGSHGKILSEVPKPQESHQMWMPGTEAVL